MTDFQRAKQTVLDACLTLARAGFIPGTGGNVALRAEGGCFAVTPSGVDYFQMSPDDICILDLSTLRVVAGRLKPSVESGLHARFFRTRADINASVHTHQPTASAITLLNQPLPVTNPEHRRALGTTIPVVPYAPSGTALLARAFGKTVRPDINAYLMRNHGIVCGGRDMPEALDHVRRLEAVAVAWLVSQIRSAAAGPALERLRGHVLELLKEDRGVNSNGSPEPMV